MLVDRKVHLRKAFGRLFWNAQTWLQMPRKLGGGIRIGTLALLALFCGETRAKTRPGQIRDWDKGWARSSFLGLASGTLKKTSFIWVICLKKGIPKAVVPPVCGGTIQKKEGGNSKDTGSRQSGLLDKARLCRQHFCLDPCDFRQNRLLAVGRFCASDSEPSGPSSCGSTWGGVRFGRWQPQPN